MDLILGQIKKPILSFYGAKEFDALHSSSGGQSLQLLRRRTIKFTCKFVPSVNYRLVVPIIIR